MSRGPGLILEGGGWQSKRQSGDIRLATCGHLSDVIHAYAFMNLIPGGTHTHTRIQSHPRAWTHTYTLTQKQNFQPCASKAGALQSWHLDNICEQTGRCQKALTAGF